MMTPPCMHRSMQTLSFLWLIAANFVVLWNASKATAAVTTTNSVFIAPESNIYTEATFNRRSLRSLQDGAEVNETISPSYYDDLRIQIASSNSSHTVMTNENSTIYQVTLNSNNETNEETVYRLAELKSFTPFTINETNVMGKQDEAFATLLAMYHFNNMVTLQTHPVLGDQIFDQLDNGSSLSSCNVKITTELIDSTYSPTIATQTITSVLERTGSISVPQTTAVVTSSSTTVTLPLAILTGIYNVPLMSATAIFTGFDDAEQFPITGRVVTSADSIAAVSLQFFQTAVSSSHIAILFVTDSFGSDIQKGFQEAATKANIVTESIAFSRNVTDSEARSVFESLKRLQYRHVYTICYPWQLKLLLTVAADLDAIGPDYLYIFPELDLNTLQQTLQVMDDSSLSKAIQGIGFIGMSAGITSERVTQGKVATPAVNESPTTGFERFRLAWKYALQDNAFRQYAQSKLPESFAGISDIDTDNYFIQDPGGLHAFMYDTVTTFGVAMCRTNSSTNFFTGQDIYDQIRNLEFMMASGNVQLSNVGSRIFSSIAFLVWNVRSVGVDSFGLSILEFVPSYGYDSDKWFVLSGNEFVFADGSGIAPESLPVIYHDYNYISRSDRIFGYALMSIILLSSVGAISWTIYNRKNHVIDAAQPLFLIIVFVGAFIMALSTIPAGFDDSVISSMNGLDAACMAIPWLYFMGSNLSSGALLAKTKAVYGAYVDPEIETIHVSSFDIIKSVLYQVVVNFILLLLWTLVAPLEWTRVDQDATDNFDRPIESVGNCAASGQSLAFAIIVLAVNMIFLIMGTFWAYKSRNITTEYDESMYIGLCIVAILQTWTIGLPILVVVRDNPSVSFYVQSALVFVTSFAAIGIIFVPKCLAVRKDRANDRKQVYKEFKRAAILRQRAEEEDSEREPTPAADLPIIDAKTTGIKILHNPRSVRNLALSGGMELSQRQLQILENAISDKGAESDDRMEQIPEMGIDDSNCESGTGDDLFARSLSKLPELDLHDEEIFDESPESVQQENTDDKKALAVPSVSIELAETTPKTDCLNGEKDVPSESTELAETMPKTDCLNGEKAELSK